MSDQQPSCSPPIPGTPVIKMPACGRIVHFFPFKPDDFSGATKLPAMVLCDGDMYPELSVFTGLFDNPVVTVKTVPHKSNAHLHETSTYNDVRFSSGYWDWPEKKQHPCFTEYENLPVDQKAKDYLFKQVVDSLRPFLKEEPVPQLNDRPDLLPEPVIASEAKQEEPVKKNDGGNGGETILGGATTAMTTSEQ